MIKNFNLMMKFYIILISKKYNSEHDKQQNESVGAFDNDLMRILIHSMMVVTVFIGVRQRE